MCVYLLWTRFCGISNSFVKRNIEGATANVTAPGTASVRTTVPSVAKVGHETITTAPAQKQPVKSSNDKGKPLPVPASKKNGQAQKSVTGTGGSLKNMWGRVPVKAEDEFAKIEVKQHDDSGLLSYLCFSSLKVILMALGICFS